MNPSELRRALAGLVTQLVDQPERIQDRGTGIAAAIDSMDALDEIRDTAIDLREELRQLLDDAGVVTKRCEGPKCGLWMRVADTGRRRLYCSDPCRQAALRAR
jgi:hypothetical protein